MTRIFVSLVYIRKLVSYSKKKGGESMKKITNAMVATAGMLSALPAFAQANLGETVNRGLNYGTIVGWGTQDLKTVVFLVINVIMGFLGIIAVVIVLWGGFQWMTAGGNEEQVASGKKTIIAGVVGLAIVIGAWAIAAFVVQNLVDVTTPA
jgi:hypothetical protein